VNQHEFVREFGRDREEAFSAEERYARRRRRAQHAKATLVVLFAAAVGWFLYTLLHALGWWAVVGGLGIWVTLLFLRGARGYAE
jgi:fatty acid desaturase